MLTLRSRPLGLSLFAAVTAACTSDSDSRPASVFGPQDAATDLSLEAETANDTGLVLVPDGSDVLNLHPGTPGRASCGQESCDLSSTVCCADLHNGTYTCLPTSNAGQCFAVPCGAETCSGPTEVCCSAEAGLSCQPQGQDCEGLSTETSAVLRECDDEADCPAGKICCVKGTPQGESHCEDKTTCEGLESCGSNGSCAYAGTSCRAGLCLPGKTSIACGNETCEGSYLEIACCWDVTKHQGKCTSLSCTPDATLLCTSRAGCGGEYYCCGSTAGGSVCLPFCSSKHEVLCADVADCPPREGQAVTCENDLGMPDKARRCVYQKTD